MLNSDERKALRIAIGSKGNASPHSIADQIADMIDAGGNPVAAHVASVSTANATDLPSAEALANANKVAINALIASLIAAGIMAAS